MGLQGSGFAACFKSLGARWFWLDSLSVKALVQFSVPKLQAWWLAKLFAHGAPA